MPLLAQETSVRIRAEIPSDEDVEELCLDRNATENEYVDFILGKDGSILISGGGTPWYASKAEIRGLAQALMRLARR